LAEHAEHNQKQYIKDLRKIFRDFDEDQNNRIDRGELAKMLRHLGKRPLVKKKIDELFAALDTDKDGSIDFDEFAKYFTHEHFVDETSHKEKEKEQTKEKEKPSPKKKGRGKGKEKKVKGKETKKEEHLKKDEGKKPSETQPEPAKILTPKDEIDLWFSTHSHDGIRALTPEVAMMSQEAVLAVSKYEWSFVTNNSLLLATAIVTFLNRFQT